MPEPRLGTRRRRPVPRRVRAAEAAFEARAVALAVGQRLSDDAFVFFDAGLTDAEAVSLFRPAPFGVRQVSAFERLRAGGPCGGASAAEAAFLSCASPAEPHHHHSQAPAAGCWRAGAAGGHAGRWAALPRARRDALRRAPPCVLTAVEASVLALRPGVGLSCGCAYTRLLIHSVAAWHGLALASSARPPGVLVGAGAADGGKGCCGGAAAAAAAPSCAAFVAALRG